MSGGEVAPVWATASSDDRGQLVVAELGGQVGVDQLDLAPLALGEVVAAGLLVGLGRLHAALALALEHGDLVAAAPSFSAFCSSDTIRRSAPARSRSPAFSAAAASSCTCWSTATNRV